MSTIPGLESFAAQRPDPPAKPPTKAEKTIGADFLEEVEQEGEQKEDEADER